MQLSQKDKQALQEKYKEQRQAMWSGKQSTSQESEEKTVAVDQDDIADSPMDSTSTMSSDAQSDPSSMTTDQSSLADTADEATNQSESTTRPESEGSAPQAEAASIVGDTEEQAEEEQTTETESERIFWEADQEGGPSILTWKIVLAVIGVAIVLIGVGVWMGFLFAG